jgi:WD40 repeat protein
MAIELICSCGKRLTADLTLAGKGMTCPACNALIAAPAEEIPELEVQIVEEDQVLDILEVVDEEAEESGCYSYQDTGNVEEDSASSARVFEGEAGTIRLRESAASLAYSPNDRWALAGVDMDIQVLDMKNHKRAFKFCKHEDKVTSMCFTPDSRGVVSADESGRMLYWDLDERDVIRRFKGVGAAAIAISPLGRYAVTGGEDGRTRFWELDSGNEYDLDKANWDHEVRCVRFSPDGRFVAAGGRGARCAVWSVETGERLTRLQGASGTVESLSFSSEGIFSPVVVSAMARNARPGNGNFLRETLLPAGKLLQNMIVPFPSTPWFRKETI